MNGPNPICFYIKLQCNPLTECFLVFGSQWVWEITNKLLFRHKNNFCRRSQELYRFISNSYAFETTIAHWDIQRGSEGFLLVLSFFFFFLCCCLVCLFVVVVVVCATLGHLKLSGLKHGTSCSMKANWESKVKNAWTIKAIAMDYI